MALVYVREFSWPMPSILETIILLVAVGKIGTLFSKFSFLTVARVTFKGMIRFLLARMWSGSTGRSVYSAMSAILKIRDTRALANLFI